MLAFLDGLGIDRLAMVGNSLGGGVVAGLAADQPRPGEPAGDPGRRRACRSSAPSPPEGIIRLVEFVEEPTRDRLLQWMRSMVFDPAVLTDEFVEIAMGRRERPGRPRRRSARSTTAQLLDVFRPLTVANPETLGMLGRIQAPTLLTWGRDDRVTPLDGAIAPLRLIPRCELHVFPDCGHWAMIERKAEFESVVLSYLLRDQA